MQSPESILFAERFNQLAREFDEDRQLVQKASSRTNAENERYAALPALGGKLLWEAHERGLLRPDPALDEATRQLRKSLMETWPGADHLEQVDAELFREVVLGTSVDLEIAPELLASSRWTFRRVKPGEITVRSACRRGVLASAHPGAFADSAHLAKALTSSTGSFEAAQAWFADDFHRSATACRYFARLVVMPTPIPSAPEQANTPVVEPHDVDAGATPSGSSPATEPAEPQPGTAISMPSVVGLAKWESIADEQAGPLLRGWKAICEAAGWDATRASADRLRQLNACSNGPIRTVRRRPEVCERRLNAFMGAVDERAARITNGATSDNGTGDSVFDRNAHGISVRPKRG